MNGIESIARIHDRISEIVARPELAQSDFRMHLSSMAPESVVPSESAGQAQGTGRVTIGGVPFEGIPAPYVSTGILPSYAAEVPERGRTWLPAIEQAAARHGLDPRLLASLVWAESNFTPDAVSHAGAIGMAQLMPGTAEGLGVDPWDPYQNLEGGARYLSAQIDRFGDVSHALAAYNAGPGRVERAGGIPNITETQNYVVRVLGYFERLGGTADATPETRTP